MTTMIATIGAFARVDTAAAAEIRERLGRLEGVETFELDEPGKLGLIIEAPDLDEAHRRITKEIQPAEGVLAVWPVFADFDELSPDQEDEGPTQ